MSTRPRDLALVVTGAALWGTGGVTGALLAGQGVAPLAVASYRLGVGGGALLLVLALLGRLGRVPRSRAVAVRVLVTGALAAAYQGFYFLAVVHGTVAGATLVALGGAPVLVAAATAVRTRRAPSVRTVLAIGLGLAGLVLLLGAPSTGSGASAALALVPAAAFATMTVLNARAVPGLGPLELTGTSFTFGALLLAPVAAVVGGVMVPSGVSGLALVLWLGLGPTAAAYAAYFAGLRSVPATSASLVALLEPLVATLGAALLLAERPGPAALGGSALLVAAIVVLRVAPTMAVGPRR